MCLSSLAVVAQQRTLLALLREQPDTFSATVLTLSEARKRIADARKDNERALRNERARRKRLLNAVAKCKTEELLEVIAKKARAEGDPE